MVNTRRCRSTRGLSAVAALWFVVTAAHAGGVGGVGGVGGGARFRCGIGVSHAMAWARIEPGPAPAFAFPPFSDPSNALTAGEIETLRHTGFDFVRLAVDPGPFLQFQGARRNALDRILLDRVKLILASGLAVVVDFHPSDLDPNYTAQALTAGAATPVFKAYLRLLERTSGLLDALHSNKVALELMNEPPVRPQAWQPMLEAAYAAARRRSADLVLVLDGGDEASAAALMAMKIAPFAGDRAVLFSFHYYDPYQFTHQGASWNAARYLADVPYPARARPIKDSLAASAAKIADSALSPAEKLLALLDAGKRLESYRRSGFDGNAIARRFTQIADWARAQGVPAERVLLGEFGARKTKRQLSGIRATERAQWFHDVRAAAQANGFGWAVWAYRGGGGFALARSETDNDIEPGIAAALGLHFRARRRAGDVPVTRASDRDP
jgi:endoglucanase